MKKIVLVLLTVFLNIGIFSCTPERITDGSNIELSPCCGDDDPMPPPPPPPPGG